mgnify:CR=1 FL=1
MVFHGFNTSFFGNFLDNTGASKGGYDVIVDFVGNSLSVNYLSNIVRAGGMFLELAFPKEDLNFNIDTIVRNEIKFIGVHGYQGGKNLGENDFHSVIRLISSGEILVGECLRFFNFESGIDIYHAGDLPARSGIGSSSSFTVGLVKAIHGLKNSKVTKRQLAEEAIFIEQKMIKESVGCQDQIAAAYGGFNVIKLGPGNKMKIAKLVISFTYREYLRRSILLGFTGLSRDGTSIMKQHVSNISQGKSEELLREINQISENAQQLLKTEEDIEKLGKLLNDSWVIKRDFTPNVSNQHFNQIYEIAMKNGAVGGKLMGAGGGGFFYFLAPPQKHAKIRSALNQIKIWVPFKFATQGSMLLNRSSINII